MIIEKRKMEREREREREREMKMERWMIFATKASQTKECKIIATAKPKRV